MEGFVINEDSGRYGGLSELRLMPIKDVLAVRFDKASGSFTELVLTAGVTPAYYEFEEDTAFYRQTVTGYYPYEKVVHDISFSLPYFDNSSSGALSRLLDDNAGGFAALVTTAGGETSLAGWSVEFEEEAPLRLTSAKSDTQADYAADSFCTVGMRSEDIALSRPFTGALD